MITTKTINNQNAVINGVFGTDDNSVTTVNGNLHIQDSNGNALTITPSGISNVNALTVSLTSDNTAGTYYIPFSKTATATNNDLYIDDVTGPLNYNPSNGALTASIFNGGVQISQTTQGTTFTAGTLTIQGGFLTFRSHTVNLSGTSNTISALSLVNSLINSTYFVAIQNNGSGNLTINTGLGANIKTTYSTNVIIPTTRSALMQINVITLNNIQTTIIDVKTLT